MAPNLIGVWRNRGFLDGLHDKASQVDVARARGGEKAERAYSAGYRTGRQERQHATRAELPAGTQAWGRRALL